MAAPVGPAGVPLVLGSRRRDRRLAFGLASVAVHGVAVAALTWLIGHAPPPDRPEEPAFEMAFAPVPEPPPAPEPVAETPPEVPPPVEPPPPELPPPEPAPPEPPPPDPVALPPPEPPPAPKPPPPRPPRPVRRAAVPEAPRPIAAPVSVPAPAPAPVEAPAVDPSWQSRVAGWLAEHKAYPEDARRRGEEGRVAVRFTVSRSGRILDAELASSSGSERLDAATVALLRGASLPAFPASMAGDRITITTTIRYTLR